MQEDNTKLNCDDLSQTNIPASNKFIQNEKSTVNKYASDATKTCSTPPKKPNSEPKAADTNIDTTTTKKKRRNTRKVRRVCDPSTHSVYVGKYDDEYLANSIRKTMDSLKRLSNLLDEILEARRKEREAEGDFYEESNRQKKEE